MFFDAQMVKNVVFFTIEVAASAYQSIIAAFYSGFLVMIFVQVGTISDKLAYPLPKFVQSEFQTGADK